MKANLALLVSAASATDLEVDPAPVAMYAQLRSTL